MEFFELIEHGILIPLSALGLVGFGLWRVARGYLRFRGTRLVACPENGQPAAVELAAWQIAVTGAFKRPTLRLRDCSRWRGQAACNQSCLTRIEAEGGDCLVLTILSKWYQGKTCICCGRQMPVIPWRHAPCVMSPDLRLCEWRDIRAEDIPNVLATHSPVCWECLVAETHTS
jgi:hypothetical protein